MNVEQAIEVVIIDKLKQSIIDNDMVATSALLNSVRLEETEAFGQKIYSIIALDYIVGLDEGVAPSDSEGWTKDFSRLPLVSEIEKWLNAKGLDLNPFAVRANIIKYGTTWYRQGGSNIVKDAINDNTFSEVINLSKEDIKQNITKQWQLLFKNNR